MAVDQQCCIDWNSAIASRLAPTVMGMMSYLRRSPVMSTASTLNFPAPCNTNGNNATR